MGKLHEDDFASHRACRDFIALWHCPEQRRPGSASSLHRAAARPAGASDTGGVGALAATQPATGVAFDYRSRDVQDYVRYLGDRKNDVLVTVANAPVIATYDVVLNGFAALLTDAEVLLLKNNAAVADVQADLTRHLDTVSTPAFLKLSAAGGLWSQFAGGSLIKGENMVVGIIDGGIWPESAAFADRVDASGAPTFNPAASLAYVSAPATFIGSCMPGEGFDPIKHCNNKLVGAKYFNAGFLAAGLSKNWSEFYSPRDSNIGSNGASSGRGGHGDHTASTAAGNSAVAVVINGVPMGQASGIAPRARVAAYKVCWTYDNSAATDGSNSANACFNSDAVKAIDEAVKDGVNVINFSISGSQTSVADAVEQAFYRAALANVFVAACAGNSGPANAVAHISPWLTTVAASTHDRNFLADVTLGNAAKYAGASTNTTTLATTSLVRAEGAGAGSASLCFSASGDRPGPARPGQGERQGRHLHPRHQCPHRQEPGGVERRRHRHGVDGQRRRSGRRDAVGANRARHQRQRQRHQGVRRSPGHGGQRGPEPVLQPAQAGADHGRLFFACSERGRQQHPQARPDRP